MWRVSSVLSLSGLSTPHAAMDESYRERGRAVHSACEALAAGFSPDVDEAHQGYIDALRLWFQKESPTIVAMERRIVNRLLGLTGRIDLVVVLDGKIYVVDVKTGSPALWHRWQVALYAILVCDDRELWRQVSDSDLVKDASRQMSDPLVIGRADLYLSADGNPRWKPHTDPSDFYIARSALALLHARHDAGLLQYVDPENPDDDTAAVQTADVAF